MERRREIGARVRQLVQLLAGTEHRVRAMIRNAEQAPELKRLAIAEPIDEMGEIPRGDEARTIVAALENKLTYRRSFDLITEETSIEEAFRQL